MQACMELHNIIPIAGFIAYDNVNSAMVNSMMSRSSMLAFETVYIDAKKVVYVAKGIKKKVVTRK